MQRQELQLLITQGAVVSIAALPIIDGKGYCLATMAGTIDSMRILCVVRQSFRMRVFATLEALIAVARDAGWIGYIVVMPSASSAPYDELPVDHVS